MRKIYSFMVAAVATIAAISCTQELDTNTPATPEVTGETVVYTASIDNPESKAALNEETKKSEWIAGDAITVFDGNKGWEFTAKEAGANVDFLNNEGFGEYRPVIAVYPAGDYDVNLVEKAIKANIPAAQQAHVGTYHDVAAIAVAYSENNEFAFKNAHALLKFKVNMDNVTHVYFKGKNEESLVGNVNIALVDSEDGLKTSVTLGDEGTAKCAECYAYHDDNHLYFEKGKTYYMVVAPQTFENGVELSIKRNIIEYDQVKGNEDITVRSTKSSVATKVNTILDLGEIGGMSYTTEARAEKIYLKPGVWDTDGAWYSAHFYNPIGGTEDVKMTINEDGLYEVAVPTGVDKVIFCRMNPSSTEFSWDDGKLWTKIENLDIPLKGDEKTCFVISDWEVGSWKTLEEATTGPKPGLDSEWALVGEFSSWKDITMLTTEDADVVVLKGVEMKAAKGFLVRKPTTDWADKYGAGNINYLKTNHYITTSKDGADMCLEADGTYDIYFNTSTKDIYVMAEGVAHSTATKQTVSGKEPEQEEPEVTEKVVYLKPNSNWTQSNARFAAYFFGNGDTWVSMTAVGDGTYEVHLPEGYDYGCNIIFCRMNPSTTANNWNNKWNQTADLKTPTDGKNLYTVKDGTWDKGGGTWSVK